MTTSVIIEMENLRWIERPIAKMKSDRMLSVLLLLQGKGRQTERELAEQLEVSQRTIHRDLEALSASRVPVIALRGSQGGWELQQGWRTQVPGLDQSELRALLMAHPRVLGRSRLAEAAETALNKLMAAMPATLQAQALHMRKRLHVDPTGWSESGEDLSMLPILQEAVERDRKLAFEYTRADGNKSRRTVEPLGLVAKGMSWYLVACGASGMRTYRVSRISSVTILAVGFERPANFDLAQYWKRSTAELEGKRRGYRVVLALNADAVRRWPRWFGSAPEPMAGMPQQGDRMMTEVEFDAEQQARFVVLGFGSDIEVLKPEDLRLWILSEAKAIATRTGTKKK
jgi:predicted DNA-binding transcriptional regulator YafY